MSVAFFFLRTYARTLTDLRYIQNEITNIEMKFIAFHSATGLGMSTTQKEALLALIKTERNHILEKGQTTTDILRDEIEADATSKAVESVMAGIRMSWPEFSREAETSAKSRVRHRRPAANGAAAPK